MKKNGFSIKARVTLWYTIFVLLVIVICFTIMFAAMDVISSKKTDNSLMDAALDVVRDVEFSHGDLDSEHVDFYVNGVSLFVYDKNGVLLAPRINQGIKLNAVLQDRLIQQVDMNGQIWTIYDVFSVKEGSEFWVRSALPMSSKQEAVQNVTSVFMICIPILAAISLMGGYIITKRAFHPIGKMTETVSAITTGNDLSLRIQASNSKDELYQLANTFNYMLERLEKSFESERQFASDASHELRTPISLIMSSCEYALNDEQSPDMRQCVEDILFQSQKMSALVSQLLLLSRVDAGKFQPKLECVDVSVLCDMVTFEHISQHADVSLELDIQPEVLAMCDETLIIRLVDNLLSNAFRYNVPNGRVNFTLHSDENVFTIIVKDTGIGISHDKMDKIWNRFYRVDPAHAGEGSGLGLSMVKWIVELHGGDISVQSVEGYGSTFTVQFPLNGTQKV